MATDVHGNHASMRYGVDLQEPRPRHYIGRHSRHKQVARIICHLRDELGSGYPQLNMPTRSMIERLVIGACDDSVLHGGEWQAIVVKTLETIRRQARRSLNARQIVPHWNGNPPLFPGDERFNEWDACCFCQVLLQYLESL